MTDYRVDENGWTWMPVIDILQKTRSSCDWPDMSPKDFDWETILRHKCSDTGFMHLVDSIMEHGWLSAAGWYDGRITEGHHRICAAILLGEEEMPVTHYGTRSRTISVDAHGNWEDPRPFHIDD